MPLDVLLDLPRLEMQGQHVLRIENHRGLRSINDSRVEVRLRGGLLRISGHELHLVTLTSSLLVIAGRIRALEFAEGSPP